MARKEKKADSKAKAPWMVTFADLMTLLLTFFVLLISMSVIDERNKLAVLGSVSTSFGSRQGQFNPKSPENKTAGVEPGVMLEENMAPLKNMLWEDMQDDLNFQENRFVQILSIGADVLFESGESVLSDRGKATLNKMVPHLLRIKYPLLIAGHTANRRDEEGSAYKVIFDERVMDSTWALSLARARSVYAFFVQQGLPQDRLTQESFGQYHPRYLDRTPDGRLQNKRVDIVLDKRNAPEILEIERAKEAPARRPSRFFFRDFQFDLDGVPGSGTQGGGN